ncbi:hypothetical protein EIP91_005631 [Steccherinum ochraceum]|uniref:Uncharacterized protein n=1 Tax=Steccherinum ochraceum TaxID=92696 RepID=A0A4R0R9R1_9APHY|nr:hypothetical protein EIP91_005631 [Steccherinum ochraceum]
MATPADPPTANATTVDKRQPWITWNFPGRPAGDVRNAVKNWYKNHGMKTDPHDPPSTHGGKSIVTASVIKNTTTLPKPIGTSELLTEIRDRLHRKRSAGPSQLWAAAHEDAVGKELAEEQLKEALDDEQKKHWPEVAEKAKSPGASEGATHDIFVKQLAVQQDIYNFLIELVGTEAGQIGQACFSLRGSYKSHDGSIEYFDLGIGLTPEGICYTDYHGGFSREEDERWRSFCKEALVQLLPSFNTQGDEMPQLPCWDKSWKADDAKPVLQAFVIAHWAYAHRHAQVSLPRDIPWNDLNNPKYGLDQRWVDEGICDLPSLEGLDLMALYGRVMRAQKSSRPFAFALSPTQPADPGSPPTLTVDLIAEPSEELADRQTTPPQDVGTSPSTAPTALVSEPTSDVVDSVSQDNDKSAASGSDASTSRLEKSSSVPNPAITDTSESPLDTIHSSADRNTSRTAQNPSSPAVATTGLSRSSTVVRGSSTAILPPSPPPPSSAFTATLPAAASAPAPSAVAKTQRTKNKPKVADESASSAPELPQQPSPRRTCTNPKPVAASGTNVKQTRVVKKGKGWETVVYEDEASSAGVGEKRKADEEAEQAQPTKKRRGGRR